MGRREPLALDRPRHPHQVSGDVEDHHELAAAVVRFARQRGPVPDDSSRRGDFSRAPLPHAVG